MRLTGEYLGGGIGKPLTSGTPDTVTTEYGITPWKNFRGLTSTLMAALCLIRKRNIAANNGVRFGPAENAVHVNDDGIRGIKDLPNYPHAKASAHHSRNIECFYVESVQ